MNDSKVSMSLGTEIKTLHDGRSAFAFIQRPLRVSLIGPLALAICILVKNSNGMPFDRVRKYFLEKAGLENGEKELQFDNAVVCAVGQLYELGVIDLTDNN